MPEHALDIGLVSLLAVCAVTDIRSGRILNAITYPAMAFGLTAAAYSPLGFQTAGEGLLAGAAAMYVGFALGAIGAGNIKLMAAVGALKGPSFVVTALFCSVLSGGIWAGLVLVLSGQAQAVLSDVAKVFSRANAQGGRIPPRGGALPFSLAIAVGTVTTLMLEWRLDL